MRSVRFGLIAGGVAVSLLSVAPAIGALGGPTPGLSRSDRTVDTRPVPGNPRSSVTRDVLTPAEQLRSAELARVGVELLVKEYPALAGLSVGSVSPVFMEGSLEPTGFMATYVLPKAVGRVQMHLKRSSIVDGKPVPETILSEITNLRALNAIVLFDSGEIVHLAPAPRVEDVAEPEKTTKVRTVDPGAHRNSAFGGDEE